MKKYIEPEYIPYDMTLTKKVCGDEYPGYAVLDIRFHEDEADEEVKAIYIESKIADLDHNEIFYLEAIWENTLPMTIRCEKNRGSIHEDLIAGRKIPYKYYAAQWEWGLTYQSMTCAILAKYGKVFRYITGDLIGELKAVKYFEKHKKRRDEIPGWYRGAKPTPRDKYHSS